MKDIQLKTVPFYRWGEKRAELEPGSEDGFSLSRRSVLTEKLVPTRWLPVPRRRGPPPNAPGL